MSVSQPGFVTLKIRKEVVAISYLSWNDFDNDGNSIVRFEIHEYDTDADVTEEDVNEGLQHYLDNQ